MKNNLIKIALSLTVVFSLITATACGDKPLKYEDPYSKYNLEDYVEIGKYEGIEVTKPEISVSKEEIKAEVEARVAEKTTQEHIKEGVAESGDKVNISYVGKKDGVAFEGGSTGKEGAEIVLGASGYIPGFDDGVIGMKVGETKDLNLTFPEVYERNPDLAGKDVVFTVTLNYKSVPKTVPYDMEFVKSVSDAKSIKEYEETVKKDLEKRKEQSAKNTMYDYIWNQIMDSAKIKKHPKEEVKKVQAESEKQLEQYAAQYGVSKEDIIENMMQMSSKEYSKYAKEQAKKIVAQEMVFSFLANRENISITQKDYDAKIAEIKAEQGIEDEAFKKANGKKFEETIDKDKMIKALMIEKLFEDAFSKAKVK